MRHQKHKHPYGVSPKKSRTVLRNSPREEGIQLAHFLSEHDALVGRTLTLQEGVSTDIRGDGTEDRSGGLGEGKWSRENIKQVRQGIRIGEIMTDEQEDLLTFLEIPYLAIRNDYSPDMAMKKIQQQINYRILYLSNKGVI